MRIEIGDSGYSNPTTAIEGGAGIYAIVCPLAGWSRPSGLRKEPATFSASAAEVVFVRTHNYLKWHSLFFATTAIANGAEAQVRAKLHLSQSEYQRLKTKGPLCEE